jgi:Ca2+-binding RTX toxin-like protein
VSRAVDLGPGDDDIYPSGIDNVDCGTGTDTIHLQAYGHPPHPTGHLIGLLVFGGAGDDVRVGRPGSDHPEGETGNDTLHGREGDDLLYAQKGNDNLTAARATTSCKAAADATSSTAAVATTPSPAASTPTHSSAAPATTASSPSTPAHATTSNAAPATAIIDSKELVHNCEHIGRRTQGPYAPGAPDPLDATRNDEIARVPGADGWGATDRTGGRPP